MTLISGERRGVGASLGRAALGVLGWGYGRLVGVRNAYYDTWAMPKWLEVPVVSVGNLTVGGTGKSPMTVWLCERLLERGRKPAVLSRGYKASQEGAADELLMISRQCPAAVAVANADRLRAGRLAIERYNVQAAILDDGFQHRRLGRDLDLLLIDATRPFGHGHMLPRGLLRESVTSVRRADAIVITRCDQSEPVAVEAIEREVRRFNPPSPILRAVHRPTDFVELNGQKSALDPESPIGCFAGIARPEAFVRTLEGMDLAPAAGTWFPDHYVYTAADVKAIGAWARDAGVKTLVTTEKDAVKLARIEADWPVPVQVLRVRIELLDGGEKTLCGLIDQMLSDFDQGRANEISKETKDDARQTGKE